MNKKEKEEEKNKENKENKERRGRSLPLPVLTKEPPVPETPATS